MDVHDQARWRCGWKLEKYVSDDGPIGDPYEVMEGEGNLLLNDGIDLLWNVLIGVGNLFDGTNARVCVGDSSTAAVAEQTDLQGSNKVRKVVDAGYPLVIPQALQLRATFLGADANHGWNEFGVANHATDPLLNRKVTAFGTKTGGTWQLTVTITLA